MVEFKKHGNIHHKVEVHFVMTNGNHKHFHNGTCCKDNWRFIYGNYKKKIDYIGVTNHNEDYLEMFIEIGSHKDCPKALVKHTLTSLMNSCIVDHVSTFHIH
jgi:hypothetical protein